MDMVEYNPVNDVNHKTSDLMTELIAIRDGGLATSSTTARRWSTRCSASRILSRR